MWAYNSHAYNNAAMQFIVRVSQYSWVSGNVRGLEGRPLSVCGSFPHSHLELAGPSHPPMSLRGTRPDSPELAATHPKATSQGSLLNEIKVLCGIMYFWGFHLKPQFGLECDFDALKRTQTFPARRQLSLRASKHQGCVSAFRFKGRF